MLNIRGRVKNGRLVVDEPTDLPDGTEVDLVAIDQLESALAAAPAADDPLSAEEASELRAITQGPFTAHAVLRERVASRRTR